MTIGKRFGVALATALATASAAPAFAHESRLIPASSGQIRLTVGFAAEPAFEDSYNGVDVILNTYDGACTETPRGSFGAPVDTGRAPLNQGDARDTVDLTVVVLYFKEAAPPTGPNGSVPPAGLLQWKVLTEEAPLKPKFNTPGTYNTAFRPTHPGVYGFRVFGTVSTGPNISKNCPDHAGEVPVAARTAWFDAYFVCSAAGSFTPPGSFNCIEAPQTFPGGPAAAYKPNHEAKPPYYGLND